MTSSDAAGLWARVRIHLNLGQEDLATEAAREASALTDWDQFGEPTDWGTGCIYATDELPLGWAWVEPENYRILMPAQTVGDFGLSSKLVDFATLIERVKTASFRTYDHENWRLLDRN